MAHGIRTANDDSTSPGFDDDGTADVCLHTHHIIISVPITHCLRLPAFFATTALRRQSACITPHRMH